VYFVEANVKEKAEVLLLLVVTMKKGGMLEGGGSHYSISCKGLSLKTDREGKGVYRKRKRGESLCPVLSFHQN